MFLTSPTATAQFLYGTLTGNITDPTGAVVPGAKVEAVNVSTGVAQSTVTNEAGIYSLSTLQPGEYKVTVNAPSFSTLNQAGIIINVNSVTRSNGQLKVAGVTETVSVNAGVQALQADRGDVHSDISTKQLMDLPVISSAGRNFESLLKLVPGVQPPAEQNSAAGNPERSMSFNVNGIGYENNNVRLDGAGIIYAWLPYLVSYVPPEEAIAEVNIETNSMLPEQGTAGGSAVNVIIKSGTNAFHGSAFEYNTNTDLNARPYFFTGAELPKNIVNLMGASMGGPIKRNKLFFFGDWERTMQRQFISGFATIPNSTLTSGNFSGVSTIIYNPMSGNANGTGRTPFPGNIIPAGMIDPAATALFGLMPQPNQNTATPSSDYFGAGDYALTRDNADGKLNYNPTENSQVFGRYSISKETIADPYQFGQADGGTWDGGQPGAGLTTVQSSALGGTHTFSPTMLMDGTLGFTRQHLGAQASDVDNNTGLSLLKIPGTNGGALQGGLPAFFLTNGWTNMGNSNTGSPFLFRDNSYVGNLNFSKIKGTHQLRFGWDYTHSDLNHFQPQGGSFTTARGSFQFNGGMTTLKGGSASNMYNSLADLLLGLPDEVGKVSQNIDPNSLRFSTWAFYAQDQWQVTPKLTLTYGLRYEYYPFLTRDHEGNFTYQPSTNDVLIGCEGEVPCDTGVKVGWGFIAPRLGFAYRFNDRTVVRGGAGFSEDPDNYRDMRNTYPAVINYVAQANAYQAAGSLTGANAALPQGTVMIGIPPVAGPNIALGTIPLPNNISTQAIANPYRRGYIEAYNLEVQRDLGAGFTATVGFVGNHEVRQMSNVNINAGYPGGGNASRLLFVEYGTVNGDINESEPFGSTRYDSLQTQLTRRVGAAQVGAVYTWSRAMDMGDNSTYNGLTFAYPTYWARNWAAAGYDRTHNFELWTAYELPFGKGHKYLQSGIGAWVLGGWQANAIFSAASGTPFTITSSAAFNAPGNTETANQILPTVQIPGNVGPGQLWFNTAAYAAPTAVNGVIPFGNTGRNSLRGPGYFQLDGSVFRDFPIKENIKLQFRAESFAITNTPIFGNPGSALGSGTFGQITSLAASANGVSNGGGYRIMRLGLRLSF
ncbi:MAG: TonB-dependent receptor [Bryobacteraceae bacterium]